MNKKKLKQSRKKADRQERKRIYLNTDDGKPPKRKKK
jgi:hypothetical protein